MLIIPVILPEELAIVMEGHKVLMKTRSSYRSC